MERLKEIIVALHPEKIDMLVDNDSIRNNASKKALQCLFGYDTCLANRGDVGEDAWNTVTEKTKEEIDREFEQSLRETEDEQLQQALLASLDDVPLIERAHALMQRAASQATRARVEKEMQETNESLFKHMIGALPVLAGLMSQETRQAMANDIPRFTPHYGLLRLQRQEQYREFVSSYMLRWLSVQTRCRTLSKDNINCVVEQVQERLSTQTTPIIGWKI